MISYIRGTLAEKNEDSAVVEAHGVGYQIFVPVPVLSELPPLGESVKIYTYFSVREDGMSLFGFLSRQDLAMFKQLIGVNGIGPKSALGILSALRPDVLRMAVASGDAKTISRAPGVGPKTAQRIILDLKDKIRPEDVLAGAEAALERPHVRVRGLMTIPPADADRDANFRYFQEVQALYVDMNQKLFHNELEYLSMGMSGDYEDAIRAGATMVRVGSAIFGARHYN